LPSSFLVFIPFSHFSRILSHPFHNLFSSALFTLPCYFVPLFSSHTTSRPITMSIWNFENYYCCVLWFP
jgi:hypothetical protein